MHIEFNGIRPHLNKDINKQLKEDGSQLKLV